MKQKSKLIFMPVEANKNTKSDMTIYIPERRSKGSKALVMIKQRIGGFEQTIYAPIKARRKNDRWY